MPPRCSRGGEHRATTGAWLLIPIGLGHAVVYHLPFGFVIERWNLRTPGREPETDAEIDTPGVAEAEAAAAPAATGDTRVDAPLVAEVEAKLNEESEGD